VSKSSSLKQQRYQSIQIKGDFSDEEMARDWTLSQTDLIEVSKYRKTTRLYIAIQLCTLKLYGRFLNDIHSLSPRISNYLAKQLLLDPTLNVEIPNRKATLSEQRKQLMTYLRFHKFDNNAQSKLEAWLQEQLKSGVIPDELFPQAESYLLDQKVLLPGASVLQRIITHAHTDFYEQMFVAIGDSLPDALQQELDQLLAINEGEQHSYFHKLKAYPPEASIKSLNTYLELYNNIVATSIDSFDIRELEANLQQFFFRQVKNYTAKDLKRFKKHKRYSLMLYFLLETRQRLLDHLVKMHDQYMNDLVRKCRYLHKKQVDQLRRQKTKALDVVLAFNDSVLNRPEDKAFYKRDVLQNIDEDTVKSSLDTLRKYNELEKRGYADLLLRRYPTMRKYFADFIHLPFEAEAGSEPLLEAIQQLRLLDSGDLADLTSDTPYGFSPQELRGVLKGDKNKLNRNAWELSIALALKDALRSGDIYLAQSKQHVSFWNLVLTDKQWQVAKANSFEKLDLPQSTTVIQKLKDDFHAVCEQALDNFTDNDFARIENNKLKLKRDDKLVLSTSVGKVQKMIDSSLSSIRIEQLLIEVDKKLGFTRYFKPLTGHSQPNYKSLIAAILSQATNLGVVAMSNSMKDTSVDHLRHIVKHYLREETIKAASAAIVNQHHLLPLSSLYGDGTLSSSDAQRFKIRASSLLASYYPRYYGYYEKAIGIYTHVSDQYSVFDTKAISCAPREALYVLDGLLENNTILQIKAHTTDTHGYTEIVFALCYLLGYDFMPRIRDLKDQQLYKLDKQYDYATFKPLLRKRVDLKLIEEQWEYMVRVAISLKEKTAPAHVVVQRLTNSFPADRLSKAFTHLGRAIKTQYVLRYITDQSLRQRVQLQLNKGEYRHKLARRIFFADQGAFGTGDYEEIMNKASCLSLISNAVLYWNTLHITDIVQKLKEQGEIIEDDALRHVSLLPYRHVVPNGTYFIEDYMN